MDLQPQYILCSFSIVILLVEFYLFDLECHASNRIEAQIECAHMCDIHAEHKKSKPYV